jgi:hypothetical protein
MSAQYILTRIQKLLVTKIQLWKGSVILGYDTVSTGNWILSFGGNVAASSSWAEKPKKN